MALGISPTGLEILNTDSDIEMSRRTDQPVEMLTRFLTQLQLHLIVVSFLPVFLRICSLTGLPRESPAQNV